LFALVVFTVGGVNATALVFVGLGPLLWFPFAVWGTKEASIRQAGAAFARIGALTLVTSLWWIAGLMMQGRYGIDILRYTETAKVVAAASVAPEVLRGLGYWFFYGGDRLGPWIEPSVDYTQRLWLIAVTYITPILALLAGAMSRWKYRAYFVTLVFVGTFVAVGAYPWDDPPVTGEWWKSLLLSDRGLALRSTPRAVPLVALGLAVFLGAGLAAIARRAPRTARPVGAALILLVIAGLPPLYTGGMVAANLQRPEDIPSYWTDAANALDQGSHDTRVFEVPGTDFASYRWGNTVDPITPGIMDRPYVARELIPYGSPASADLLNAVDRRLQENTLDPNALTPIARFMAVGDVVARNDLQYERFRVARPYDVMALLNSAPGLGNPTGYGPAGINQPSPIAPMVDEAALRDDSHQTYSPVESFPVSDATTIVRAAPASSPVVVAGDGDGLVGLASAGLLDGRELVVYSGSYANDQAGLQQQLDRGAALVLTDSNRRRARRWSTLRDNVGYTEQAGEQPLREDLTDNRLPVFPDAGDDAYTVAEYPGGVSATASSYGNPITYTPEFRASNAVDGDLRTSWRTASSSDARGEELVLRFAQPVDTDHLRVTQLLSGYRNRTITKVDLRFDGKDTVPVELGPESNTAAGQVVTFPQHTFSTLEMIIRADDSGRESQPGRPVRFTGLSEVGFSEVDVDGRRGEEILRLPTDLLTAAASSSNHPLTIDLERQRIDAAESVRDDEELAIARTWTLPSARDFTLGGQARLSPRVGDDALDLLLGVIGPTATSSRRLPGDVQARASSAIDGDPTTAWQPAFDVAGDDVLTYQLGRPLTFSHLDLQVVADGRHSVPTHLRIEADGVPVAGVAVPAVADRPGATGADAVVRVPIDLPNEVTGTTISVVVDGVRDVTTTDWFSSAPVRMPVGIAELGIDGLAAQVPTGEFDSGCRTDLLRIDDRAVSVELSGSVDDATAGRPLDVKLCGSDAAGISLGAGDHVLRAAKGLDTGLDLDQLVLQSAADGTAPTAVEPLAPTDSGAVPTVTVDSQGRTDAQVTVTNPHPGEPFWLVLGQSHNEGWTASADGHDLGKPQLVDGYANGWLISTPSATVKVNLQWTPQRLVWICLALSAIGVVLCLVLAIRRPRRRVPDDEGDDSESAATEVDASSETADERAAVEEPDDDNLPAAPTWASFSRYPSRDAPPFLTALAVTVGAGLLTAAVVGPIAGGVMALVTLVVSRRHRARWWLALGAPALLAVAAGYVLLRQARSQPTAAFEWPGEQAAVHQVAWMAVMFLVVLVVVDLIWERVTRRRLEAAAAAASAPPDDASLSSDAADFLP
jgi:arabinofuranan 3-O-arabinosyltransferase